MIRDCLQTRLLFTWGSLMGAEAYPYTWHSPSLFLACPARLLAPLGGCRTLWGLGCIWNGRHESEPSPWRDGVAVEMGHGCRESLAGREEAGLQGGQMAGMGTSEQF